MPSMTVCNASIEIIRNFWLSAAERRVNEIGKQLTVSPLAETRIVSIQINTADRMVQPFSNAPQKIPNLGLLLSHNFEICLIGWGHDSTRIAVAGILSPCRDSWMIGQTYAWLCQSDLLISSAVFPGSHAVWQWVAQSSIVEDVLFPCPAQTVLTRRSVLSCCFLSTETVLTLNESPTVVMSSMKVALWRAKI